MGLGVRELFDNNIKVHFAGSDGGEIFYAALLAAQTKYRLFSCYKSPHPILKMEYVDLGVIQQLLHPLP